MSVPAKTFEIDPLLHPVRVAKLLGVSLSWLATPRLRMNSDRRHDLVACNVSATQLA